ncbi:MAG: Slp family lipoprotein [Nitrospirales bacterium]
MPGVTNYKRKVACGNAWCIWAIFHSWILMAGCSTPYVATLPGDLASRVDLHLNFLQIKESPDSHKGKLVMLGGQILEARRLKDSTQLIILQLPLIDEQEPVTELTQSQGRFIANQQEFLDPATVPSGTRVTVVGEISGSQSQSLDETTYDYPTVIIKNLKVWPKISLGSYLYPPYPYYGYPFYPYPYPFYGPRGGFWGYYPYW